MKANREDLLEKLPDLYEGYRLCENHFEEKMFTSHLHTRLVANALPTLFPSLEGSSRTGMAVMGEHSYNAPPLYSAKIRILDDRTIVPASLPSIEGSGRPLVPTVADIDLGI